MKATGIVRRVDDLGRVVIPKEIRKTLLIKEGSPLEIYTEEGGCVVFKKYSAMEDLMPLSRALADVLFRYCGVPVAIADTSKVLVTAGAGEKIAGRQLSEGYANAMEHRGPFVGGGEQLFLLEGKEQSVAAAAPILVNGDLMGSVAALFPAQKGTTFSASVSVLVRLAADLTAKHLEC